MVPQFVFPRPRTGGRGAQRVLEEKGESRPMEGGLVRQAQLLFPLKLTADLYPPTAAAGRAAGVVQQDRHDGTVGPLDPPDAHAEGGDAVHGSGVDLRGQVGRDAGSLLLRGWEV